MVCAGFASRTLCAAVDASKKTQQDFLKASNAIAFPTKKQLVSLLDTSKAALTTSGEDERKKLELAMTPMKVDMTCCAGLGTSLPSTPVTTMMLRNIPSKYTQEKLMYEIDENGFSGTYDFFHLPTCRGGSNVGYAFINFLDEDVAKRFLAFFTDYEFRRFHSRKVSTVSVAHAQGLYQNLRCFQNRAATSTKGEQFRPTVFKNKVRVDFDELLVEMDVLAGEDESGETDDVPVESREPKYVKLNTRPSPLATEPQAELSVPPGLESFAYIMSKIGSASTGGCATPPVLQKKTDINVLLTTSPASTGSTASSPRSLSTLCPSSPALSYNLSPMLVANDGSLTFGPLSAPWLLA